MAPMKHQSINNSSSHGEAVSRQASVLASCYLVDPTASLKGLHYCTTGAAGSSRSVPIRRGRWLTSSSQGPSGIPEVPISGLPSPPSSPPLAAFTSSNHLELQPKPKKSNPNRNPIRRSHRGGATLQIKEECERFFCETMNAVFQGERNMVSNGSVLTGVHHRLTPPDDCPMPPESYYNGRDIKSAVSIQGWMEFWDYSGGASFRAFVAEDGSEKSVFAFLDFELAGRDLKPSYVNPPPQPEATRRWRFRVANFQAA